MLSLVQKERGKKELGVETKQHRAKSRQQLWGDGGKKGSFTGEKRKKSRRKGVMTQR